MADMVRRLLAAVWCFSMQAVAVQLAEEVSVAVRGYTLVAGLAVDVVVAVMRVVVNAVPEAANLVVTSDVHAVLVNARVRTVPEWVGVAISLFEGPQKEETVAFVAVSHLVCVKWKIVWAELG